MQGSRRAHFFHDPPATKYPCPVCTRYVTSRGVGYQCNRCTGWVHTKCSGLLNAAQYRRSSDWTCDPFSAPPLLPLPPPTPSSDQTIDDSMFNDLQLNANGIGNKLTELGVVMENNKVKVAAIQYRSRSSNLNPRTSASRTTPQLLRTVLMVRGDYSASSIDR